MSKRDVSDEEPVSKFIAQWTSALAREKEIRKKNTFSAVLFRVNQHFFALAANVIREVVDPRKTHSVPHRSDDRFLGILNIRGTLHLCFDLANMLGLSEAISSQDQTDKNRSLYQRIYPRMVVVERAGKTGAFSVDEILTFQRFPVEQLVSLVQKDRAVRAILEWRGKTFDVLDENRLFEKMDECL